MLLLLVSLTESVSIGKSDLIDDKEWAGCVGAMKVCQFKEDELSNCWKIIASILHLGNIHFNETEKNNMPVSFVENRNICGDACHLLKVYTDIV